MNATAPHRSAATPPPPRTRVVPAQPAAPTRPLRRVTWTRRAGHLLSVVLGAVLMTTAFFSVLPVLQAIAKPPRKDLTVRPADQAILPQQPEEEPEIEQEEPEPPPPPPELADEPTPLDLSQLSLALNPTFTGGWGGGDLGARLDQIVQQTTRVADLFDLADLDQKPRVVYRSPPVVTPEMKRAGAARVLLALTVDAEGRVQDARVLHTENPLFDHAALAAVKKWRFEPGKQNGRPVSSRLRLPMTFKDDRDS